VRQIGTTGKSPKVCPDLRGKIFPLPRRANQAFNFARLPRQEGRSRSSRPCGGMRWTLMPRLTSVATAYGEIVWVRRPDAGVKFKGSQRCPRAMVSQKAGSPGRSRISRKAVAWGRPVCSPLNLYARGQHISLQHACETAGAARTRSSPRPLLFRRANEMQNSGRIAPREGEVMLLPFSPCGRRWRAKRAG
jgi:hypothetical protein